MLSNEDKIFIKQQTSLYNQAEQGEIYKLSNFLNIHEQSLVKQAFPDVEFRGGFLNSERVRAIYQSRDYFGRIDDNIVVIEIEYAKKYVEISHRDVLGSLIGLGLSRTQIGDIIIDGKRIQVALSQTIIPFLEDNFTQIGRNKISFEIVKKPKFLRKTTTNEEVKVSVTSLRLDLFVANVYKLPRSSVTKLFEKEKIFIDHKIVHSQNTQIETRQLISIRTYGRILVVDISLMKNGKYEILYQKF